MSGMTRIVGGGVHEEQFVRPNVRAKPRAEAGRLGREMHHRQRAARGQAGPP